MQKKKKRERLTFGMMPTLFVSYELNKESYDETLFKIIWALSLEWETPTMLGILLWIMNF